MTPTLQIGRHPVGLQQPTYFVADIAANHDGSLDKAIDLIGLCAEAGANAAKFQNFAAHTIGLPQVDPFVAPILHAVPVQLLAYHTAVIKKTDVDQPRNLAKSVTVE